MFLPLLNNEKVTIKSTEFKIDSSSKDCGLYFLVNKICSCSATIWCGQSSNQENTQGTKGVHSYFRVSRNGSFVLVKALGEIEAKDFYFGLQI